MGEIPLLYEHELDPLTVKELTTLIPRIESAIRDESAARWMHNHTPWTDMPASLPLWDVSNPAITVAYISNRAISPMRYSIVRDTLYLNASVVDTLFGNTEDLKALSIFLPNAVTALGAKNTTGLGANSRGYIGQCGVWTSVSGGVVQARGTCLGRLGFNGRVLNLFRDHLQTLFHKGSTDGNRNLTFHIMAAIPIEPQV